MRYFFVLGEHPAISLAEIYSWLKKEKIAFETVTAFKNILIIQTGATLDVAFLMRQLGGTIKIGLVAENLDPQASESWGEKAAQLILSKTKADQKNYFGLSIYGDAGIKGLNLGLDIKKILVRAGRKVRLVTSREPQLSSVVVQTNKLLTAAGLELVIISWPAGSWLGYTLAVQPFAKLSERDYGRPGRDARSGLLPLKLAKILINLAEISPTQTLLDPFCGSGTILTEAWLSGYQTLLGSDSSDQAIKNSQKNIDWLVKKFQLAKPKIVLKKCDVRALSPCWPPQSVEAIVTEPWLGPPLTGREAPAKIKNTVNELGQLYLSAFKQFKKILKPGGRVVFIFPAFKQDDGWQKIMILDQLAALGFKQAGEPLFYARPDQRVGRQIVKFISV